MTLLSAGVSLVARRVARIGPECVAQRLLTEATCTTTFSNDINVYRHERRPWTVVSNSRNLGKSDRIRNTSSLDANARVCYISRYRIGANGFVHVGARLG